MRGKVLVAITAVAAAVFVVGGGCSGDDGTPPDGGASVVEESSPPPLSVDAISSPSCTPNGGTATILVKKPDVGVSYEAVVYDNVVEYGDVVTTLTNPTAVAEGVRFTFRCKDHPDGHYGVQVKGGGRSGIDAFDVYRDQ